MVVPQEGKERLVPPTRGWCPVFLGTFRQGPTRSPASLYAPCGSTSGRGAGSGSLDQSRGVTTQLRERRHEAAGQGRRAWPWPGRFTSRGKTRNSDLIPRRSLCCTPGRAWRQARRAAVGLAVDRLGQAHVEMRYAGAEHLRSAASSTLEGPSRVIAHLAAEAHLPAGEKTPSWLAGTSCDGWTVSVTGATAPCAESMLVGAYPGIPVDGAIAQLRPMAGRSPPDDLADMVEQPVLCEPCRTTTVCATRSCSPTTKETSSTSSCAAVATPRWRTGCATSRTVASSPCLRCFAANAAWMELMLTAADLLAWCQDLCLHSALARAEAATCVARCCTPLDASCTGLVRCCCALPSTGCGPTCSQSAARPAAILATVPGCLAITGVGDTCLHRSTPTRS